MITLPPPNHAEMIPPRRVHDPHQVILWSASFYEEDYQPSKLLCVITVGFWLVVALYAVMA